MKRSATHAGKKVGNELRLVCTKGRSGKRQHGSATRPAPSLRKRGKEIAEQAQEIRELQGLCDIRLEQWMRYKKERDEAREALLIAERAHRCSYSSGDWKYTTYDELIANDKAEARALLIAEGKVQP